MGNEDAFKASLSALKGYLRDSSKSILDIYVLLYRTESVAEKMLTNWFTFLLYKFLKVSGRNCLTILRDVTHYIAPLLTKQRFAGPPQVLVILCLTR